SDMMLGFTDYLAESLVPDQRYTDPVPLNGKDGGEISNTALDQVRHLLREALEDESALVRWFGELQTNPRYPDLIAPPRRLPKLTETSHISLNPASRLAWHASADSKRLLCFIDGETLELKASAQLI